MDKTLFEQACQVWRMEDYSIHRLPEVVHPESFTQVAEAIADCIRRNGRILVGGLARSGILSRTLVYNLGLLNATVGNLPLEEGLRSIQMLQRGDMLILISKGGCNDEVVRLIGPAQQRGATVVGITQNPASMLGMWSDLLLRIMVVRDGESNDFMGTTGSLTLYAILDGLAAAVGAGLAK